MGITVNIRKRLAVGIAGALLAGTLVLGVAPVAAADDGGSDGQFVGPGPEHLEAGDRQTADDRLTITALVVPQAPSFDTVAPMAENTRFVENLNDRT